MTTTTTFDALGYFEKLKAVGVPEEQAKLQANAFRETREAVEEKLVTKAELAIQLKELEVRILRWMVGGFMTQTALLMAVLALMR